MNSMNCVARAMVSPASRRWGRAQLTSLLDRPSPTLRALHPALPARRRSRDVYRRPARLHSAPLRSMRIRIWIRSSTKPTVS